MRYVELAPRGVTVAFLLQLRQRGKERMHGELRAAVQGPGDDRPCNLARCAELRLAGVFHLTVTVIHASRRTVTSLSSGMFQRGSLLFKSSSASATPASARATATDVSSFFIVLGSLGRIPRRELHHEARNRASVCSYSPMMRTRCSYRVTQEVTPIAIKGNKSNKSVAYVVCYFI
jgi:hypothetical protein